MKKSLRKGMATTLALIFVLMTAACSSKEAGNNQGDPSADTGSTAAGAEGGESQGTEGGAEETYDFGGVTVKAYGGVYDNLIPDKADVDLKWLEAKEYVDKKYNINLTGVKIEGDDGTNDMELILSSVAAGDPATDIMTVTAPKLLIGVKNDLLMELTPYIDMYKVGSAYTDAMSWNGKCYGISFDDIGSCWAMVYDRDLVKKIGMEKTPTEMFMEGKWDYDNFVTYLADMKAKLPDGVYPIGAYPFHWPLMAGAANGVPVVDSTGHVGYKDEAFLQAVQLYKDLQTQGLAAPVTTTVKDDGTTGYNFPWSINDETIVLKRAEQWEFASINYDFGIVPYPWGPNVTCDGDYTTLSDNYKVSFAYWGGMSVLKTAEERTGIPGEILAKIAQDYEEASDGTGKKWMHDAYEKEQAGEQVIFSANPGAPGAFSTEEDIAVNDWMHSRFTFEWGWIFDGTELLTGWDAFKEIYGGNKEVRGTLESYYRESEAKIRDSGILDK